MHDYILTTLRTTHDLTCDSPHPGAVPVLTLDLSVRGPNLLTRDLLGQLLDVSDDFPIRCQSCQTQFERDNQLPEIPPAPAELSFDERLTLTRAAIARIADLWGCDTRQVDVSIRNTGLPQYTEAIRHPEASSTIVGLRPEGKLSDSWVIARFQTDNGTSKNLQIGIMDDHAPRVKEAFGGHWPHAFVPHVLATLTDNVALCHVCHELLDEHVLVPSKDGALYVWDSSLSPDHAFGWEALANMNVRDSGDGRKQNDLTVPYAGSMADTANSATSN